MSTATIAVIGQDIVSLAAIGAVYFLLKQGGGLQAKTPPAPRQAQQPQQGAAGKPDPLDLAAKRGTAA